MKKLINGRVAMMGNVDSTKIQIGDKQGIIESAEYALKNGMLGGGYIFSTCNSVFEGISLENYMMMLDVRKKMGGMRYD